ncbi:MAG: M20/M25/M40 family metallo-hydrolase [Deltaproteobacteria bacterium]|nr:M20/M25/M40 family metallo-hydrolase [Deltaproteobacteria bacterium]
MARVLILTGIGIVVLLVGFLAYSLWKVRFFTPAVGSGPAGSPTAKALRRHVEHLTVRIGSRSVGEPEALGQARDYITETLGQAGFEARLQAVPYAGRIYHNVIAAVPGSESGELVVVGAHYDTVWGTPGADDNGSAVAVLLEVARALAETRPRHPVELAFFTLEEPPVFPSRSMGSSVYAAALREAGRSVRAMICLEMVGYYQGSKGGQSFPFPFMGWFYRSTPDFVAVIGNWSSRGLAGEVAGAFREAAHLPVETLALGRFVPGVDFSDHRWFWAMGWPAVMVTDTAFYRNPHYHRSTDTIDTLDFGAMAELVKGLVRAVRGLAEIP